MKKEILLIMSGIVIGFAIGSISLILIMNTPKVKYDLNDDGKVNILDLIKLRNYILDGE